jgi:hypothetical protein
MREESKMHRPVKERLEEYLRRTETHGFEEVEAHLKACGECRRIVSAMERQSVLLRALRVEEQVEPAPGFYGRVLRQIDAGATPSFWSVLLDPQFGRRLVYSALTILLLLSTYIVSTEPGDEPMVASATQTLVEGDSDQLGADPERDRNRVLVQLTSFGE